jgi:serine/threonine protein phosphatase PrpC
MRIRMALFGKVVGMMGLRSIRNGMHLLRLPRNPLLVASSQRTLLPFHGHVTKISTTSYSNYPRGFWTWRGGDDKKRSYSEGSGSGTGDDGTTIDSTNAGVASKQPILSPFAYPVSVCTAQGFRSYMEDEYFLSLDGDFAAVFDGHGGQAVSRYLRKNLYANVQAFLPVVTTTSANTNNDESRNNNQTETLKRVSPTVQDYESAIESALDKVDREVQRISHWSYQGSTAVGIWLHEERMVGENEATQRTIIAANVGDSRAVLCRNGTGWDLTRDHKPNDPHEKSRIEQLGGEVVWCGDTNRKGEPVPDRGIYRVNGNLALSRAIGDRSERPHVTAEPEIITVPVEEGDEFIILATDGLWDVFESDEAVEVVLSFREDGHDQDKIATMVVEEALRRGTYDNITVVIIWLERNKQFPKPS